MRICKRCALGDERAARRFFLAAGRADKDILTGSACPGLNGPGCIIGIKCQKIHHRIKVAVAHFTREGAILDTRDDNRLNAIGEGAISTRDARYHVPALEEELGDGCRDYAGATNQTDFHVMSVTPDDLLRYV